MCGLLPRSEKPTILLVCVVRKRSTSVRINAKLRTVQPLCYCVPHRLFLFPLETYQAQTSIPLQCTRRCFRKFAGSDRKQDLIASVHRTGNSYAQIFIENHRACVSLITAIVIPFRMRRPVNQFYRIVPALPTGLNIIPLLKRNELNFSLSCIPRSGSGQPVWRD